MESILALFFVVLAIVLVSCSCQFLNRHKQDKRRKLVATKRYRVNKSDSFTIQYQEQPNGTIKIYCTEHPRNSYSADATKCHLYGSGEVCVTSGKEPRSLDRAKAIAMMWMEGYSRYVRTGRFPNSGGRVRV